MYCDPKYSLLLRGGGAGLTFTQTEAIRFWINYGGHGGEEETYLKLFYNRHPSVSEAVAPH